MTDCGDYDVVPEPGKNGRLRKFIRYSQGRIFLTVFFFLTGLFFIDLIGFKYWQYALFFIPARWIIGYFVNEKAFEA